jgi:tRNA(Ile)-lysidine synthase
MNLPGRVHAFARQQQLWTPETDIIAAVSGGADSVALLLVLHALSVNGRLRLAGVAHLNHRIRGRDAEADAVFVRGLAGRFDLPFFLHEEDVPARANRLHQSVEVAGRHARLEFFERLAAATGSPRIALAHTRTDQAETVVLRLARGAGPRGLAGMSPRTGHRVRPLLEESRGPLRAWLRERGETWREDDTNADSAIARNLVRLDILPRLTLLNAGAEAALARSARIQRSDAELLDRLAESEAARLVKAKGATVRFSMQELRSLHEALARRVVRVAMLQVHPGRTPAWDDTELVLGCPGGRLDVGAVRLELFGDLAVLSSRVQSDPSRIPAEVAAVALTLNIPGVAGHPRGWWTVEAQGPLLRKEVSLPADAGTPPKTEAARVVVDAAAVGRHLTIRSWAPGDRVQPLGLGGRKKLQDVFVDRKVPRDERVRVPVVVAADGRIVWVGGHVLSEPFRVTPRSEAVVVLTLRH